jgi:hypothetical protein
MIKLAICIVVSESDHHYLKLVWHFELFQVQESLIQDINSTQYPQPPTQHH